MGSSAAGPALLKAWLSWLKGGLLLRLLSSPILILAACVELSPVAQAAQANSLILQRLSRRLRKQRTLTCTLNKGHESDLNSLFFVGGGDVMDRAQSQHKPNLLSRKRSMTLDNKATRPEPELSGGSPTSSKGPLPPQPSGASDTPSTTSTLSHPSPTPSPSSSPSPSPPASIAPSPSPPPSIAPSPAPSMPSHARSMSHADVSRQGKRLSLQFPIQPAAGSNSPGYSPRSRPSSWVAAPSPVPSPDATPSSSTETNILAVLAAQERYVLELKEELTKAEEDLKTLKKHWATHEAVKQRNEVRKVTQLQPLNTSLANYRPDQDDEDGSTTWMQQEMERRKALLSSTKTSSRKTFSGSRHLRTLSLLSPDKAYTPSFPQPLDIHLDDVVKKPPQPPLMRHSTSPDIANHIATTVDGEKYDISGLSNIQRDALLRTGKQMATDFKDGLLTFIEDIRQATVGDEAAEGSASAGARVPAAKGLRKPSDGRPPLNRAATSLKKPSQKTADIGDDFWKEHGLSEPKTAPAGKKAHANKNTRTPQKQMQTQNAADDFDEWDWNTPNDKDMANVADANNSSDESEEPSSPVSGPNSSRTSTSSMGVDDAAFRDAKRNSIPWPDLVKLSPTNLKRTASHLMKEWEKNLTPPPESRDSSHSSGDYIGRSSSPAGLP